MKDLRSYIGIQPSGYGSQVIRSENSIPGPISNDSLFEKSINAADDKPRLKKYLSEGLSFSLVPEELWNYFVSWYGLTKPEAAIPRKVVGGDLYAKVEIYPFVLKLATYSTDLKSAEKDAVECEFSKDTKVHELKTKM